MRGTFVAVVGPSGSGKDTLIREALERRPDLAAARRVVSRPANDATEVFESVTAAEFARARTDGRFALDWHAHGLLYAIQACVERDLAAGRHVLANLSRQAVAGAREQFQPFRVVVVTAPGEVLACRLRARGREDPAAMAARLHRARGIAPEGPDVVYVDNGGSLEAGVRSFLEALPPRAVIARSGLRSEDSGG